MLSQSRLREWLHYDAVTGIFTNNATGRVYDGMNTPGYIQIGIDGVMYTGHRLAWLYVHGQWPKPLDHVNGVRNDNRLSNLREASQSNNMGNARRHHDNKSGFKGVFLSNGRWTAQICHDYTKRHLGCFDTPELAHEAYCKAAQAAFGEFARAE